MLSENNNPAPTSEFIPRFQFEAEMARIYGPAWPDNWNQLVEKLVEVWLLYCLTINKVRAGGN